MITSDNKMPKQRKTIALLALMILMPTSWADDVQVYLVPPPEPIPPNVLFILDESGSMGWASLTPGKNRNEVLKEAMTAVIDDSDLSNVNAAIMGYTSGGVNRIRVMSDFITMDTDVNRTALKNAVNGLQTLSGTPTVGALGFGIEWFKSSGGWSHNGTTWTSPLNDDKKYCQKNSIVLLTDGEPNNNSLTQYPSGTNCASDATSVNGNGRCAREMGDWVYNQDLRSWDGKQNVTTFTVSMVNTLNEQRFMRSVACEGHGKTFNSNACNGADEIINGETVTGAEKDAEIGYYLAGSEGALADALKSAIQATQSTVEYTFNTPSIPLNPDNAAVSGNYIYVPILAPEVKDAWKGNLKKYKIKINASGNVEIRDANNAIAVNSAFQFKDTAQSLWSSTADGNNPLLGGAASKIFGGSRTIYTRISNNDLTDDSNLVSDFDPVENSSFANCSDASIRGLFDVGTEETCVELVKWLTTGSIDTGEVDSNGEAIIDYKFGAPIHSKPVVINYASKSIVYMPTSDGILHAIDADTGAELWGYIPAELLQDVLKVKTNGDNDPHPIYGLDGEITVVHNDANGNSRVDGGEKVLLVFGQRRGGNNYYALDVTSYNSPKFKYQIMGGTGNCSNATHTNKTACEEAGDSWTKSGTFGNLAQTWSKPVFFKQENTALNGIDDAGDTPDALIFGGGYDADTQDIIRSTRVNDDIGNSIYIVNAWTGSLISHISVPAMKNSIAANVAAIDINSNGKSERFYTADMGGRIIRIDFEQGILTAGVIANLGGVPNIKFFNKPTVAYHAQGSEDFIALVLGSGNRAEPLDKTVSDSFFMVKDPHVWSIPGICSNTGFINKAACVSSGGTWNATYTTVVKADLTNVTSNYKSGLDAELMASKGWVLNMPTGVKVMTEAIVFDYAVIFSTYSGDKLLNADICQGNGAAGESAIWAIGLLSASAIFDLNDDGDTDIDDRLMVTDGGGLPPKPSILLPGDDVIFSGGLPSSGTGEDPKMKKKRIFYQLFWEEVIDY